MKNELYTISGEHGNLKIRIITNTYGSAIRAGRAVLKSAPEFGIVNIQDRKGNILKVIRGENRNE